MLKIRSFVTGFLAFSLTLQVAQAVPADISIDAEIMKEVSELSQDKYHVRTYRKQFGQKDSVIAIYSLRDELVDSTEEYQPKGFMRRSATSVRNFVKKLPAVMVGTTGAVLFTERTAMYGHYLYTDGYKNFAKVIAAPRKSIDPILNSDLTDWKTYLPTLAARMENKAYYPSSLRLALVDAATLSLYIYGAVKSIQFVKGALFGSAPTLNRNTDTYKKAVKLDRALARAVAISNEASVLAKPVSLGELADIGAALESRGYDEVIIPGIAH